MLPSLIKQDRESLYVLARSNNILVVHGTALVCTHAWRAHAPWSATASNVTLLALIYSLRFPISCRLGQRHGLQNITLTHVFC
jgi:hypothetical protein